MTSSVRGIVGVAELDGRPVRGSQGAAVESGMGGPITRRVFKRYQAMLAQ